MSGETERQRLYRMDAEVLGQLGCVLAQVDLPNIEVRLPRDVAESAVAAWERDDTDDIDVETFEQRVRRRRAATLALIGLSIVNAGRWEGEEVVVPLGADLIGVAVDVADDMPAR